MQFLFLHTKCDFAALPLAFRGGVQGWVERVCENANMHAKAGGWLRFYFLGLAQPIIWLASFQNSSASCVRRWGLKPPPSPTDFACISLRNTCSSFGCVFLKKTHPLPNIIGECVREGRGSTSLHGSPQGRLGRGCRSYRFVWPKGQPHQRSWSRFAETSGATASNGAKLAERTASPTLALSANLDR